VEHRDPSAVTAYVVEAAPVASATEKLDDRPGRLEAAGRSSCRPPPDRRLVRQMIRLELSPVVATDRAAIDEQVPAAMAADMAQRHGLEYLTAGRHSRFSEYSPLRPDRVGTRLGLFLFAVLAGFAPSGWFCSA
jgi:hypothetical protein